VHRRPSSQKTIRSLNDFIDLAEIKKISRITNSRQQVISLNAPTLFKTCARMLSLYVVAQIIKLQDQGPIKVLDNMHKCGA
jgi:hypothetical protein